MLTKTEVLQVEETDYNYKTAFSDNNDDVVFDRNAVISVQPFSGNESRRPLPIATISGSMKHTISLPLTGLALLYDIQEISIEQTIEIYDLVAAVDSENKYLIKTDGQILLGGYENSSALQRMMCGMGRAFMMRFFDRSHQEALYMTRRAACSLPLVGFYLQRMDVFEPPCNYLGCVQQQWTASGSSFSIRNQDGNEIYSIIGPTSSICCCTYSELAFNVTDVSNTVVATIENQWDPRIINYKLIVKFPATASLWERALLLASGILLEYMFFQTTKTNCCSCSKWIRS